MTTKPTYQILSVIDYASLDFDPNESEPLPEGMEQKPAILRIINIIDAHLKSLYSPEEVFIDTNTPVCYNRDNLNDRVMPDVYIAFDVDARPSGNESCTSPGKRASPPTSCLKSARRARPKTTWAPNATGTPKSVSLNTGALTPAAAATTASL